VKDGVDARAPRARRAWAKLENRHVICNCSQPSKLKEAASGENSESSIERSQPAKKAGRLDGSAWISGRQNNL